MTIAALKRIVMNSVSTGENQVPVIDQNQESEPGHLVFIFENQNQNQVPGQPIIQ